MDETVQNAAMTIWDYMLMHEKPSGADCLLVLGSRDERVAAYAAALAGQFHYGTVVITGGIAHQNDLLATAWAEDTEAEHFMGVMRAQGYKGEVHLETEATNTGENAKLSYQLLQRAGKTPRSLQLVTKPYMERRAIATFEAQWPDPAITLRVSSPPLTFESYCDEQQPVKTVINIMVGDLQRIMTYPARGWQSKQPVPRDVKNAYAHLVLAGYPKHLEN